MPVSLAAAPEVQRVLVTLVAATVMLALASERTLVVPLALQYTLVALLLTREVTSPLFAMRAILTVAISANVYITGSHMEQALHSARSARQPRGMGRAYRLAALAWALMIAFGLWYGYPLLHLPRTLTLAAYALMMVGATCALVSTDPLRMGAGALLLLAGFEAILLSLESSLVVVALFGMLEIVLALAVSFASERWIEVLLGGGAP